MGRQYEGTPLEVVYDSEADPTVAAQQCGLDEKALNASCEAYDKEWLATELHSKATAAAIRAYLEAATPPDVAKIARSLEALAEHLTDQPLAQADSTDLKTIRQAATALRLSAGGGEKAPEALLADEILAELVRARTKFPGKNVTFAALVEEVGELATATFEEGRDRVRKEAVQVAVMAMRMVLDGDHTFDDWRASKGLDALTASPAVEAGHVE